MPRSHSSMLCIQFDTAHYFISIHCIRWSNPGGLIPSFLYLSGEGQFYQAQPSAFLPRYDNLSHNVWVFRYLQSEFQFLLQDLGFANGKPAAQVFRSLWCSPSLGAARLLWLIFSFGSLLLVSVNNQGAWVWCIQLCCFAGCSRLFKLGFRFFPAHWCCLDR